MSESGYQVQIIIDQKRKFPFKGRVFFQDLFKGIFGKNDGCIGSDLWDIFSLER